MESKKNSLKEALSSVFGPGVDIISRQPVFGGDINNSYRLNLSQGGKAFLKTNNIEKIDTFKAEINGLYAIKSTDAIPTPVAFCIGTDKDLGISFLLMEFIESKRAQPTYWKDLGTNLAKMHTISQTDYTQGGKYGFYENNFIGHSKQYNFPLDNWVDFYRENRLKVQFDMARKYFDSSSWKKVMKILDKLHDYLPANPNPSLLHGDLWSGNIYTGNDGRAWLIDPACYIGHFEADLAMTMMFGGFSNEFYDSYNEINPLPRDFETRRGLYDLYQYLNHLNMFGRSYLRNVMSLIDYYG